ncbi:MAG: glycosyltransferase family 2 protein [Bacteroidetes bacterium]|nr:glycosyltransferase family 2 protein [Bacteroidota bacterium]
MRISVVVITHNEEKNIERCIRSVRNVADEILIVDSYSTDKTAEIARSLGATVIEHHFEGYGKQKRFATEQAKNDWVMQLDADESLSPELEQSILAIDETNAMGAYKFDILTNYCGKWIRHGGWYPNPKTRLVNRKKGSMSTDNVHEKWTLNDANARFGRLKGDLLHYSYYTIADHIYKINHYSEISAKADAARGKKCSMLKVIFAPCWFFFVQYVLRRGFMDGAYGYIVSKNSAYYMFLRYSKLYSYSRNKQ